MSVCGYQYRARSGGCLHPRGDIGSIAENIGIPAGPSPNHHGARVDADPCRELGTGSALVEFRYGVEYRQARTRGTFGVVVMCFGMAKIGHHAVAEVLGDVPAEALDGLRRCMMIPGDDFSPLFRIEMASYLGRADEIAEKHGQMPALALWRFVLRAVFDHDGCGCGLG